MAIIFRFKLCRVSFPLVLPVMLVLVRFTLQAQTTTLYDFMLYDRSARIAALSGNTVSLDGDIVNAFQNPALFSKESSGQGSASFQKHFLDINSGFLAYGFELEDIGSMGIGITYVSYGTFDEADELGNITGSFSAADLAIQAGISRELYRWDNSMIVGGAAVKYIFSSLAGLRASAFASDFGLFYKHAPQKFSMGISLQNLGFNVSTYNGIDEPLPVELRFALSKQLEGLPLILTAGFIRLNESSDGLLNRFRNFTIGGEFLLGNYVRLRFGYNNQLRQVLNVSESLGFSGLSAGFGAIINQFRFDYGLSSYGAVGSLHQMTLSTTF
ncbi:MAG: PorV/PorQ family protein [Chloroherpetonaceae bacterium]|nr:PorV/PorQ family protein [Chloroherpetonaceae bacterium]